jgi:hypothetical protein
MSAGGHAEGGHAVAVAALGAIDPAAARAAAERYGIDAHSSPSWAR